MSTRRPCIGVFDSGFGGLTVLKELIALAPEADYIYFGDTARLPYGSKSAETVARYAIGAAQYLEEHGAQMLVIACNTATALALDRITQASSVPVVGVVDPGAARPRWQQGPSGIGAPCGQVRGWPRKLQILSVASGESMCSNLQACCSISDSLSRARLSVKRRSARRCRRMMSAAR